MLALATAGGGVGRSCGLGGRADGRGVRPESVAGDGVLCDGHAGPEAALVVERGGAETERSHRGGHRQAARTDQRLAVDGSSRARSRLAGNEGRASSRGEVVTLLSSRGRHLASTRNVASRRKRRPDGGGRSRPRRLRSDRRLDREGLRLDTARSADVLEDLTLDLQNRAAEIRAVLRTKSCQHQFEQPWAIGEQNSQASRQLGRGDRHGRTRRSQRGAG